MGKLRSVYDIYPEIDAIRVAEHFPDITADFFWKTYEKCKSYSMIGIDAFYNIYRSVEYIALNNIPGDFVECGNFLGGAILAMSDFAHHFGLKDRQFYLYDTFEGFPENIEELDARGAVVQFGSSEDFIEVVRRNIATSLYPQDGFIFVPGKVEDTLPKIKPDQLALLRLDTDYYESTRVELEELYPRLAQGGVLIIDDFGCFQGARRATDEYVAKQDKKILLGRINYSVRFGVKP